MNKKVILIVLCVVFVVLLCGSAVLYERLASDYNNSGEMNTVNNDTVVSEQNESPKKNEEQHEDNINVAPDVEVYDKDGNSIMLSSFYNKPVVLNFWATWCGPCKSEMPGFNRLYEKYKDKVNFVMLNVSDDEKTVSDFLSENGYDFPVYFDKTQIASYTYGASSIPLTFALYQGGKVYGYQIGVLSEEALEGAIKTLLGEE